MNSNDDSKQNSVITQLPKPITVTGSAVKLPPEEKPEPEEPEVVTTQDEDDTDVLPMPAAFGTDDEEDVETATEKKKEEPKVDKEELVSTNEEGDIKKEERFDELPTSNTTPSKDEEKIPESAKSEDEVGKPVKVSETTENNSPEDAVKTEKPVAESSNLPPKIELPEEESNPVEKVPVSNTEESTTTETEDTPTQETEISKTETAAPKSEDTHHDFVIPNLHTKTAEASYSPSTNAADLRNPYKTSTNEVDTILHHQNPSTHPSNTTSVPGNNPPVIPPTGNPTTDSAFDTNPPSGKSTVTKVLLGLVALLTGGSLVVGGYFAANKFFGNSPETVPQQAVAEPKNVSPTVPAVPTPTPVPEPTPTPEPEIDKTEIAVKILNGSGVKGAAGKAQKLLESAGFEDVDTGNADKFTYKETTIDYKEEYEELVDVIIEDLGSGYNAVKGEELKASSAFDILITLGDGETEETDPSTSDKTATEAAEKEAKEE
ncbi:MAG: LytR C-terminal domain-containing protein [Patescibacteria group bacterium]|jgi:hypothetical protein